MTCSCVLCVCVRAQVNTITFYFYSDCSELCINLTLCLLYCEPLTQAGQYKLRDTSFVQS